MVNLLYCELLKLKRSKIIFISILGALATPIMLLIEVLQNHVTHPDKIFYLSDVYDSSLLYVMILTNFMIYAIVASYLFSREYTENTLKTIIPIPVSKGSFIASKFCVLLLWTLILTIISWGAVTLLMAIYHAIFVVEGFHISVMLIWLGKHLIGSVFLFILTTPFTYLAQKTKGFVMPMIATTVIAMGSVALSNHDMGALYPWTSSFFLVKGTLANTGYPIWLSISIIAIVALIGFFATFIYFRKEDVK